MVTEKTIFYDGNDLKLSINFESDGNAQKFVSSLYASQNAILISNPFICNRDRDVKEIVSDFKLKWILCSDYDNSDYDSPDHSINVADYKSNVGSDASSCTVSNPENQYLMIENPNNPYIYKLPVYKCHLKSKKDFPDSENDPNNILKFSWPLHQRFDSLNTYDQQLVPQIAIRFVRSEGSEFVTLPSRYDVMKDKVIIAIESPDIDILNAVHSTLKIGSEFNYETLSVLTFVHVDNADVFRDNLMFRYNETKTIWDHSLEIGVPIPQSLVEELRRSRRLVK